MKTKLLLILSLVVPSLCFGFSGRIVLSFSEKLQSIEGSVLTNHSSDTFSVQTSDLRFQYFAVSKKAIYEIKTSLSNAFADSFDKGVFNSAFMENVTDLSKEPTDGGTLKMNWGSMKKFFDDFLIKSNCQITMFSETNTVGATHWRIYFYKPD